MPIIIDEQFTSDVSAMTVSAGTFTYNSGEGPNFANGYGVLAGGSTIVKTFTAITSGIVRLEFWWRDAGTSTTASRDTYFYLLPDATVSSANSAAAVVLSRDAANGGTSALYSLRARTTASLTAVMLLQRDEWAKIAVVVNMSARTYDVYVNDMLMLSGVVSPNAAFTQIDRIAVNNQTSAENTLIDDIKLESDWALTEATLIEQNFVGGTGEIEDSTPTTDNRNVSAQQWIVPGAVSGFGSFSLGANGGTPDSSALCVALARCTAEGIAECEWKSSVSGTVFMGIAFRFWDFPTSTGAGAGVVRIRGGATNTIALFLPDASGNLTSVASAALTPAANTTYTIKVVCRGRYYFVSYKAASIDAGSYTLAFTHSASSSAAGGRGMLAEELHGPYIDTTVGATDNYCRAFRWTGTKPAYDADLTIGENTFNVSAGSLRHFSNSSGGGGGANIFRSRGIQFSHRSRGDGAFAIRQRTLINGTHVKAYEQRTANMTEFEWLGVSRPFITLLRRGPWIADNVKTFSMTTYAENFAPDWDLDPRRTSTAYLYATNTGSAVTGTNTTPHDWISETTNSGAFGYQKVTNFASGDQIRMSQAMRPASTTIAAVTGGMNNKWENTGDPASYVVNFDPGSLTSNTDYTIGRGFIFQRGAGLTIDSTTLEQLRDDLKTPATLTITTGTLKTDAAGDYNADGFNDRHGWHEITCGAGGVVLFTLPVASGKRFHPVYRFWSWSIGSPVVSIAGTPGVSGTDYLLDDLGDGTAVLQILSDRTADTLIQVSGATGYKNLMLLGVG